MLGGEPGLGKTTLVTAFASEVAARAPDVPLAIGQVRILQGLRRRNPAKVQQWSIITALSFLTPYAYLMIGGNRPLPTIAYVVIACLVLGAGAATVWRIRSERAALLAASKLPPP